MKMPATIGIRRGSEKYLTSYFVSETESATVSRLRVRKCGMLAFRDSRERGFEHIHSLVELLVRNDERHQETVDVIEGARGDKDQAMLVAVLDDLFRFGVGRLTRLRVAHEFHCAHYAEAAHVADQRPLFLPATGAALASLADGC